MNAEMDIWLMKIIKFNYLVIIRKKNKYIKVIFEKFFIFKGRVVSAVSRRSAILQKLAIKFFKTYHSNEVGYDSNLETLPGAIS